MLAYLERIISMVHSYTSVGGDYGTILGTDTELIQLLVFGGRRSHFPHVV